MDIARINCAHDGPEVWRAMTAYVRQAGKVVGRDIKVLMDVAGTKIRTEAVATAEKKARCRSVTGCASSRTVNSSRRRGPLLRHRLLARNGDAPDSR